MHERIAWGRRGPDYAAPSPIRWKWVFTVVCAVVCIVVPVVFIALLWRLS